MTHRVSLGILACLLALMLLLTGCSTDGKNAATTAETTAAPAAATTIDPAAKTTSTGFYFDTVVTLTFYGADAELESDLHRACAHYQNLLSKTVEGSDVWNMNHAMGKPVKVDPETWHILRRALEIGQISDRAFSMTVEPITILWDFTGGTKRMPTQAELDAALPLVNDEAIVLGDDYTVTMPAGAGVDLGGIAKGYIADKLAEMCRGRCTAALLNFGGNVYVVGRKPDGTDFRVGINDPDNPGNGVIGIVNLPEGTLVTSGTYERYFDQDGVRYHHILDPKTGVSAVTDLTSVTIVGMSSMDADAYATACIVMGHDKALAMLEAQHLDAVLVDTAGNISTTTGFADHYPLQIIEPQGT